MAGAKDKPAGDDQFPFVLGVNGDVVARRSVRNTGERVGGDRVGSVANGQSTSRTETCEPRLNGLLGRESVLSGCARIQIAAGGGNEERPGRRRGPGGGGRRRVARPPSIRRADCCPPAGA